MERNYIECISQDVAISQNQVLKTIKLLRDGATIPFISRYRKEITGNLNEVEIAAIFDRYDYYNVLKARKQTILKSLEEQKLLSAEIKKQIEITNSSAELEDIYLPFKPKRKTKASIARAKGLEPFAKLIYSQTNADLKSQAYQYKNNECKTLEDVFQGARDIMAEWISENASVRNAVRNAFSQHAVISSKVIKTKIDEADKYKQYFEFSELLKKSPSHRVLAIMRGNKEGVLRVSISVDEEKLLPLVKKIILKAYNNSSHQVMVAIEDSLKRLVLPSIENEFYSSAKSKADIEAIKVFSENLRQLLMLPPLGQKRILAIDPGFRTGCKVVCLNEFGDLLHNETIYPHQPQAEFGKSMKKITQLVATYKIEAIAIGNGTASRETEQFIKKVAMPHQVEVFIINESGASIYSASKIARDEFPNFDVTVRGAVSIGRRLMDPLAELVKIDPKSIGVGQYQHDVNQTELQKSLDLVVESCVNRVGVQVNTASKHLLAYVAGLGPILAENIVAYRTQNGTFKSREELLKIPKMGKKTYEQCAGFLRIEDGENPLDNSAVHPESYTVIKNITKDLSISLQDIIGKKELLETIDLQKYVTEEIGLLTLQDIVTELQKPGRDPRQKLKHFAFDENISKISDLCEGQVLPGIVTNLTNFGAFVDIGIKENGLVHISQITKEFITNPADVLSLNQHVTVKVVEVDCERKRIQLSMKDI